MSEENLDGSYIDWFTEEEIELLARTANNVCALNERMTIIRSENDRIVLTYFRYWQHTDFEDRDRSVGLVRSMLSSDETNNKIQTKIATALAYEGYIYGRSVKGSNLSVSPWVVDLSNADDMLRHHYRTFNMIVQTAILEKKEKDQNV